MSLSNKLSITDVDLKGKRVLVRVSFPSTYSRLQDAAGILVEFQEA
jgi:3-phosphoglycerate kinase